MKDFTEENDMELNLNALDGVSGGIGLPVFRKTKKEQEQPQTQGSGFSPFDPGDFGEEIVTETGQISDRS